MNRVGVEPKYGLGVVKRLNWPRIRAGAIMRLGVYVHAVRMQYWKPEVKNEKLQQYWRNYKHWKLSTQWKFIVSLSFFEVSKNIFGSKPDRVRINEKYVRGWTWIGLGLSRKYGLGVVNRLNWPRIRVGAIMRLGVYVHAVRMQYWKAEVKNEKLQQYWRNYKHWKLTTQTWKFIVSRSFFRSQQEYIWD